MLGHADLLESKRESSSSTSVVVSPVVANSINQQSGRWNFFSRSVAVPRQLTEAEEKQQLLTDIRELATRRMFVSVNRYVTEGAVAEMQEHVAALGNADELQRREAISNILQKAETLLPDWGYANCDEDAGCGGRVNMKYVFLAGLTLGVGGAAMSFYFVISNHFILNGIYAGVDVAMTGFMSYKMKNHISEMSGIKKLISDCKRYIALVEQPEIEMAHRL